MGRFGVSEIIVLILVFAGIAYLVNKNSSSGDNSSTKSSSTAYLLWLLSCFGLLGFHRFYLGKIGTGLLWFFTGGLLGIGAFFDLFTLGGQVDRYNTNVELKTIRATTFSNSQHIKSTFSTNENNSMQTNQDEKNNTSGIKSHQEKIEVLQSIKDLLDKGILTQEEFDQQKTQILEQKYV